MKTKKIIALGLSTALLAGIAASADYIDVSNSDWFYPAVNTATEHKWFSGYEDGSFKPNNNITRAEAAKVIMTYKYGIELPTAQFELYSDIDGNEWFAEYVKLSGQNDIIPSASDKFNPNEYITREDTVVALAKIKGIEAASDAKSDFTDISDISDYAINYIAAAGKYNLVSGFEDGSFKPKNPITRAQFAQVMMNAENIKLQASPTPAATEAPTATPAPTPTPSPTAKPTATPVPTPVPVTEDFKDKNIFIFGDSFVTTNNSLIKGIKDALAPKALKTKNAASLCFTSVSAASMINNAQSVPDDADYIITLVGRYDWEVSYTLGDETSAQENDFTGGLNAFLTRASEQHPNAKLVVCTIPNISTLKSGFTEGGMYNLQGLSVADYSERIKLICSQKHIDVIDLNSECWGVSEMSNYLAYESQSFLKANTEGIEKIINVITDKLIEMNKN